MTTTLHTTTPLSPDSAAPWPARHLSRLSAAAGVTWLALGLESIIRTDPRNARDVVFYVPFALTLATIVGIHQRQRSRADRFERWSYVAVSVSMVAATVCAVPMFLGGVDSVFYVAVPFWIVSMAAFGVATARTAVFPRWIGVSVALSELLAIATGVALSPWVGLHDRGSFSGAVAHGVVFLAIAAGIHRSGAIEAVPA